MALVDQIADGLADEVRGDGIGAQAMGLEDVPAGFAIAFVLGRLIDFKMIAPAGEFDAVVAEAFGLAANFIEAQVGPLPGKKCDWTSHFFSLSDSNSEDADTQNKRGVARGQMRNTRLRAR